MGTLLDTLIAIGVAFIVLSIVDAVRASKLQSRLRSDTDAAMAQAQESQRLAEANAKEMVALAEAHQQKLYGLLSEQNELLRQVLEELKSRRVGA